MTPRVLSSSSISGTNIYNRQGESLGEVKELMVNMQSGQVEYVVVSFGGFLGIGDKYFAVPLEAFDVDTEDEKFILDANREKLENSPGFDKDNWPSTADNTFTNRVYNHYGVERRTYA
jgi:sporulation protein YlmC with PRC-barrel domain